MTSYGIGVNNPFGLLGDDDGAPVMHVKPKEEPKPVVVTEHKERHQRDRRPERRGKREFDRHSGSGRSGETKREGNGRFNWGRDGDQANEDSENRRRPRRREENEEKPSEEEAPQEEPVEKEPNSEDEQQDLQDYMKQLAELAVVDDTTRSIRQAVDEDDDTQALDREAVQGEEDELLSAGGIQSRKGKKKPKKKGTISLEEFTKGQRRRRERHGDRRGHGSYGGQRAMRGNNRTETSDSVDIEDKSAFPSLVSAQ